MATVTTAIQAVTLLGSVVVMLMVIGVARRWPEMRLLMVTPALWAGFNVIFYPLVLTDRLTTDAATLWSAIHRLLTTLMIFGVLLVMWSLLEPPKGEVAGGNVSEAGDVSDVLDLGQDADGGG